MSEGSKLSVVQVELGRIRDIRRAGIKISKGEEEILTLAYVPDSALAIIMDGSTYAQGLGLVNQIGTPLEKTIYEKINAYLGMKGLRLDDSNLGSLLKFIEEFNNGSRPINDDTAGEIKEKGSRAKKVFTIDLGRTILSLDVDYKFTIDDGFGNSKDFQLPSMIGDFLKEEFNKIVDGKALTEDMIVAFTETCTRPVSNWDAPTLNGLRITEQKSLLFTAITRLYFQQMGNHMLLDEANKKKAEREEKEANKEPKKAPKKDVIYSITQSIIQQRDHETDRYVKLTPAAFEYDYEQFVLEVLDPIYRYTQRKSIKENIEVEGRTDKEIYKEYKKVIKDIVEKFNSTGKPDFNNCIEYLDSFSSAKEGSK